MNPQRAPIITVGQLYLHEALNEYMIVTHSHRGQIRYEGKGFKGQSEDQTFVETFQPVNPTDVDSIELNSLASFCGKGVIPTTGFIQET